MSKLLILLSIVLCGCYKRQPIRVIEGGGFLIHGLVSSVVDKAVPLCHSNQVPVITLVNASVDDSLFGSSAVDFIVTCGDKP